MLRKPYLVAVSLFLLSPILIQASRQDPFGSIRPQDRALLEPAIRRFAQDQINRDWADLWEIDEQDIDTKRDFLLKDDAPIVPQKEYVERKEDSIAGGGVPVMTRFELTSVVAKDNGFLISGCSAAKRESFHFKGIVDVIAHIHEGKVTFGSWGYRYSMPHSCSLKDDSE